MTTALGYSLRRRWWRRFHRLVRVGWFVVRNNPRGSSTQAYIGFGMIGLGLMMRRRRRQVIYSETLDPGEEFRVRVTRGDASMFVD